MNNSSISTRLMMFAILVLCSLPLSGCGMGRLAGGMAQNFEYQKRIEVLPQYSGLENQTVAVIVEAGYSTMYQHQLVVGAIQGGVSEKIRSTVPGVVVLDPKVVSRWQYQTHRWFAKPLGEIADELMVDRLVHIDIYEFRLHPEGNSWEWEGVCGANVGVIERDGFEPDEYVEMFNISVEFPGIKGLTRDEASSSAIELGLLRTFVKKTSWLFYKHLEPKHPDKYQGPQE